VTQTSDERRAYEQEWARSNPEKIAAKYRRYYLAHREERRSRRASWRRAWSLRNPDKVAVHRRGNWFRHRAARLVYLRRYRLENLERLNTANARWNREHPESRVTKDANRRARLLGAIGSHTTAEWLEKCALLGNLCIYCGEGKPLTRDHKIPLSRGGTNSIDNIVPACRSCNSRKGTRLLSSNFVDPLRSPEQTL
jgi:5-methylcytosine-specific restriction endonuclease McrA